MIVESIPQFREAIKLNPDEKSFKLFLAKSLYHMNENHISRIYKNTLVIYKRG